MFCRLVGFVLFSFVITASSLVSADGLSILIIDGQNNHQWEKTTPLLVSCFINCARFDRIDVATTPPARHDMSSFAPTFKNYDVVVSNYTGDRWSSATEKAFVDFVAGGGGFVSVHAADNAFPDWIEYNQMIGLGGWNGRSEKSGPYVYYQKNQLVTDTAAGRGGHHGSQHEFLIETREPEHPIVKGLPTKWLHTKDELYQQLRGPAENLTVLATAYAAPEQGGSGRDEPLLMVIDYGKGRVFHTAIGHTDYSMNCIGFLETLKRGTEWAATGKVTLPVPEKFPTEEASSSVSE